MGDFKDKVLKFKIRNKTLIEALRTEGKTDEEIYAELIARSESKTQKEDDHKDGSHSNDLGIQPEGWPNLK